MPLADLAASSSRVLTNISTVPSGDTNAIDPSNTPVDCSVMYQNVESRNGSPPFIMTTLSTSPAFSISLAALLTLMGFRYLPTRS